LYTCTSNCSFAGSRSYIFNEITASIGRLIDKGW
jgi:hypothetical protein